MSRQSVVKLCSYGLVLVSAFMLLFGCSGDNGAPGNSTGTISGTVTSNLNGVPVAGATLTTNPLLQAGPTISTDSNGAYSATLPIGVYQVTVAKPNYTSQTFSVSVVAGQASTTNIKLVPTAAAAVSVADATAQPGGTVTIKPRQKK